MQIVVELSGIWCVRVYIDLVFDFLCYINSLHEKAQYLIDYMETKHSWFQSNGVRKMTFTGSRYNKGIDLTSLR